MEERGVVLEAGSGTARVRITRSHQCDQCPGCLLGEDGVSMIAQVVDTVGVSPGDIVRLETRGATPLRAALLLFLLPLAFVFAGYGAGAALASALGMSANASVMGAAGALLFFVASFGVPALRKSRARAGGATVVEIVSRGSGNHKPDSA